MNKLKMLKNNFYILKYYTKHTPIFFFACLLLEMMTAISHVVLLPVSLLIVTDVSMDKASIRNVIIVLCIIFLFSCLVSFLRSIFFDVFNIRVKEKINKIIHKELYMVAKLTDVENYDQPKFYDKLYISIEEVEDRAFQVLESLKKLVYTITGFVSIFAIILTLSPIALIFILAIFVLNLIVQMITENIQYKLDMEMKPHLRKRDYTRRVFFLPKFVKAIKIHSYYELLMKKFKEANDKGIRIRKKYVIILFIITGPVNFLINFFFDFVVFNSVLVYQMVVLRTLTIGGFSALFFAAGSLQGHLGRFSSVMSEFQKHSLYIENLIEFKSKKNQDQNNECKVDKGIKDINIQGVTFSYPNSEEEILKDINLNVKKKEVIGIVGHNGAGKTTLIKLLLKLYKPDCGEIKLGERNIQEYNSEDYRNSFGTVFQNYNLYALNLRDNVVMKNIEGHTELENKSIIESLKDADFEQALDKLPKGLETTIYKEFHEEGINFSGGEAQKIALARILYSDKDYIILDEPSSALDPISEYNFNQKIIEFSKNKTVFIITHRLSTAVACNRIIMIDDGQIIEQGTHAELMKLNGKYRYMYDIQSAKYI